MILRIAVTIFMLFALGCGSGLDTGVSESSSKGSQPTPTPPPVTYTVTVVGEHLTASPESQKVQENQTAAFALAGDAGYRVLTRIAGSCPTGSWSGGTYTTGAITSDCSIEFSASTAVSEVSAAGTNVTISPSANQILENASQAAFTVVAPVGYTRSASVTGTCPAGSWSGNVYTTGALSGDCSVSFSATLNSYTVSSTVGAGVTRTPSASQTVNHGGTQSYTVSLSSAYVINSVTGTCPAGSWSSNVYTTGPITATCTVGFTATSMAFLVPSTTPATGGVSTARIGTDANQNVYLGGYVSASMGGNTLSGTDDFYIAKVDPNKNILWVRQMGAAGALNRVLAFGADSLGNTYLAGYTGGNLDGNTRVGTTDLFIAKYDTNGNKLWLNTMGVASRTIEPRDLALDAAGNIYVVGSTTADLPGNTRTGTTDSFIMKFDGDGTNLWIRQFGASGKVTDLYGVDVSGSTIIAVGRTNGTPNTKSQTLTGSYDYLIAKYDTDGIRTWIDQKGSPGQYASANEVTIGSSGSFYVTGMTNGPLEGQSQTGSSDLFIGKYNSTGTTDWLRQRGSTSGQTTMGIAIAVQASGTVFVLGEADVYPFTGATQLGQIDSAVLRYDSSGNFLSVRQFGGAGSGRYYPGGIQFSSNGDFYISGVVNTPIGGYNPGIYAGALFIKNIY